jgi:hypothetical protein
MERRVHPIPYASFSSLGPSLENAWRFWPSGKRMSVTLLFVCSQVGRALLGSVALRHKRHHKESEASMTSCVPGSLARAVVKQTRANPRRTLPPEKALRRWYWRSL